MAIAILHPHCSYTETLAVIAKITMSENLSNYIILISVLIFLTIGSLFIGFFEGPQIGHYINIISVISTIWLTLKFGINNKSKFQQIWDENRTKLILATFGILLHLSIASTFMIVKYGYSNWSYKNPIELISPNYLSN